MDEILAHHNQPSIDSVFGVRHASVEGAIWPPITGTPRSPRFADDDLRMTVGDGTWVIGQWGGEKLRCGTCSSHLWWLGLIVLFTVPLVTPSLSMA